MASELRRMIELVRYTDEEGCDHVAVAPAFERLSKGSKFVIDGEIYESNDYIDIWEDDEGYLFLKSLYEDILESIPRIDGRLTYSRFFYKEDEDADS